MKVVESIPALPPRPTDGHKGTFGTVGLVAGSEGMLGAAILAARAALRGGAGLVQACLPETLMAPFTIAVPAATTSKREVRLPETLAKAKAIVVGPGLGNSPATRDLVQDVLATATATQRLVLDADALNVLAPLQRSLATKASAVLTPHPGEAARLLPDLQVRSARRTAVRELACRSGQVAVLKGRQTLVCDGERLFVNATGNSGLATGGSGDVLAGLLGALLAQGMDCFEAACLAVHLHGKAADVWVARHSEYGLTAEDLPLAIAEVMR